MSCYWRGELALAVDESSALPSLKKLFGFREGTARAAMDFLNKRGETMKTHYLLSGLLLFTLFLGKAQAQEDPIVVQGNPPLTQSMVAKTLILLEWSLDIRLSDEQKTQIAQAVSAYWKTNNRAEINSTLEAVKVVDGLRLASPEERARAKEIIQAEMLRGLRSDTNDEISQMVLKMFEATHSGNSSGPQQINMAIKE